MKIIIYLLFVSIITNAKKPKPAVALLGDGLVSRLQDATNTELGETIVQDLHEYLILLDDVFNLMKSKNGDDVCKGMEVFNVIEGNGGPLHPNLELDYTALNEKYQWDESEVKGVMSNTKNLWKKMEDRAYRLRNGIPDPETEEEQPQGASDEGELH